MPLTFDYPLEKLYDYQGRNPKPADHAAYWAAGLNEMRAIDPQVELIPADFQTPFAKCYHLTFTGIDGARIYAKLLRPVTKPTTPQPAVLFFHGYSGDSGDWSQKLPYVAAGYTVAALDCRGQGGRSEDVGGVTGNTLNGHIIRGLTDALNGRPEKLLFRQIFLDTAQLAKIVMDMPEVDENRVGVTGNSQGGALTVACAALEPRIKRVAPIFPFLSDYQRVWEMDMAKDAFQELKDWFRRFDPQHAQEGSVFTQLGYIDIQHLADRITGEVNWFLGLSDTICPPSTQFAAYNKITSPKKLEMFPDFGHENLPGHQDMVLQFMLGL
ncbi:MAG: cephalosporin-C deacetylase [Cellvibrionaceae bacterium]|jgi:cephalosporin-C deacetylase